MVIEKILKAFYAKEHIDMPYAPKSHDLSFLASKLTLKLTDSQESLLDEITRFNLDGRYDDYKNSFYKLCTKDYTKDRINDINTIRDFLLESINESEKK
ncbi:MAG: HEPN domain-containing protein [Clostridia bacterium]|nr:HEPN domain-containing protein [Clostridia bacterium]